jgi:hypothetical protein
MDLAIIAGVMYVAYNFSSTSDRSNTEIRNKVSQKDKFSGKSIYESTRFDQVNTEIKKIADKAFRDGNDPKSFTIPPFYNSLCNTDGCDGDKKQKISKNSILPRINEAKMPKSKSELRVENVSLQSQIGLSNDVQSTSLTNPISILTGKPLQMTHNNMVPFFKGTVTQSTDIKSNVAILERFTGKLDNPTIKKEVKSFYDQTNKQEVNGNKLYTDKVSRDRFYQSGLKNNISPTPQLRVKPLPQEVVRPVYKTIDELRVSSNPKKVFEGRIIHGQNQSTTARGIITSFEKNKPEIYHENDPSKYFTGSTISGPALRENFDNLPCSNRQSEGYMGPAQSAIGQKIQYTPAHSSDSNGFLTIVSAPHKESFHANPVRNFAPSVKSVTDYGKGSFIALPNERDTTSRQHVLNMADTSKGNYLYNPDQAKTTQKELNLFEYTGNAEAVNPAHQNYEADYNVQKFKQNVDNIDYKRNVEKLIPAHQNYEADYNVQNFKQNVDNIDYKRNVESTVKNTENRQGYENYKTNCKEEILNKNGYTSGPQKQTDTVNVNDINLSHCKTSDNYNGYLPNTSTYDSFNNNQGISTTNNLKCLTEIDHTDRIGSVFIKSLDSNPYEIKRQFK